MKIYSRPSIAQLLFLTALIVGYLMIFINSINEGLDADKLINQGIFILIVVYFFALFLMNSIVIDDRELRIENPLKFWKTKAIYQLSDIEQIEIKHPGKGSFIMIWTNDTTTKYSIDGLNDSSVNEIADYLMKLNKNVYRI